MSHHFQSGSRTEKLLEQLFAEKIERFTLSNGLTVVFKEDHASALASVQMWVKTGSIHEGAFMGSGVSHYLEHMLFKGTDKRDAQALTQEIHQVGGHFNAYTTYDRTVYYIDVPAESVGIAMDVLADMSFHSKLTDADCASERDVILREIDMGMDDPDRQSFQSFTSTAFRHHPYRYPVIGERTLFERLTPADLRTYYHSRYTPNNMVLVVVGAIELEAFSKLVDTYYSAYPMQPLTPVYIEREPLQMAPRYSRLVGDYNITRGMIGYKVPGLSHADAPCLDMLSALLGQGQSAILNQRVREELKLVHQIDTSCWNPGEGGIFWVSYTCDEGKREAVDEAVFAVLREVAQHGVPEPLLQKAMRQAMVGEVNVRKTMGGQAARLGAAEVSVGDLGYPRIFLERLNQVTVADLQRAVKHYFKPSSLTAVSLEPEGVQVVAQGAKQPVRLNDFEEVKFSNGARLLMQQTPSFPKVHFRVVCLGGPLWEPVDKRGATGILATLLTKDTQHKSARAVAESIEFLGGTFNEFAGNNTFGLGMELLSGDINTGFEIIQDSLLAHDFKQTTFELERDGQIASILEDEDEIVDYGKRKLREKFFGSHPYAVDALGTVDSVKQLTLDDIEALAKVLLVAPNVVVSVGGSFDRDLVIDKLGKVLKQLPEVTFNSEPTPFTGVGAVGRFQETLDREQAVVFQAYPDVGIAHDDYYVSEVMDEMFSGMSSQLFQKVREQQGLAYYIGSSRMIGIKAGMFYFYSGTQPSQAAAVLDEIDKEIARVQAGDIGDAELKACQTRLKVQKRMALQSPGGRVMNAALNVLYGIPLNAWRNYDASIDAVSIERLRAFAQLHFTKAKEVRLVVGPEA